MDLPNLNALVDSKFVIVLGAGASIDYGFPSWNQLRERLLDKLQSVISENRDQHDVKLASRWKEIIDGADFGLSTIDHVISENYGNLVERHWIVQIIKNILSECEKADIENNDGESRWIERFSEKYLEIIDTYIQAKDDRAVLNVLSNLVVVSLNYDRCFAYYFFPRLRDYFNSAHLTDRDFLSNQRKCLTEFFVTYQPHGSLGFMSLPGINRMGNPVTSVKIFDGNKHTDFGTSSNGFGYGGLKNENNHIELVGEGDMQKNYERINDTAVKGAKYCLVIGLSSVGLEGCGVNWSALILPCINGQSVKR